MASISASTLSMYTWLGFILSLAVIMLVARRSLPLALLCGALILGFFTLPVQVTAQLIRDTLIDPSVLLLGIAMGFIPMIGGTMKESGQMDSLVNNLRIGKKGLMAFAPAMMGLLPMPGGALLSAPILEKGGIGVDNDLKVAINDWFRHVFVLIYPLSSALIASAKIASLNVYNAALYLMPTCCFALVLGYIFFLRRVQGCIEYEYPFSLKGLLVPLCIVLVAPVLDFSLKKFASLPVNEIATVVAVATALSVSIAVSRIRLDLTSIARRMKPWNFTLIIIGMFVFLNIFRASDAVKVIGSIPLPPLTLCVVAGFVLGVATGRVILPASIILPVYLTYGVITPIVFAIIYSGIFFGYVVSPVHPCVGVSIEYFNAGIKDFLKLLFVPTMVIFAVLFILSILLS
jgi:integral membrane protein (TIGR00529 family)